MASETPHIVPLQHATRVELGGKAAGLARLMGLPLQVPPGFVVASATPGQLPAALAAAFRELGGPVAVRSSASDEDGSQASFAGQYATVLDVADEEQLRRAVEQCLQSLHAARASAYRARSGGASLESGAERLCPTKGEGCARCDREAQRDARAPTMSVVVQQMVQARTAGVLFTVDPVTSRRDRVVVDAVPGSGEALVSGQARPDHFELSRDGELRRSQLVHPHGPLLSRDELRRMAREALAAEECFGVPLDLEWAIDTQGRLFWLQSRPITTLDADPNEFDTPVQDDHWYTLANIGEMLPGAACPLDLSTTVLAIDQAIQYIPVACGVQRRVEPELQVMAQFHGHLFFDLSAMLPFARNVGGASAEQLMYAICGRIIEEIDGGPPGGLLVRGVNGLRYLRFVLTGEGEVRRLIRELRGFALAVGTDARATYHEIDCKLPTLFEGYRVHIQSSTASGLTAGVLQGVLARGKIPTAEQEADLARLLAGARGVESAELVDELDRLADGLARAHPDLAAIPPRQALDWLRSTAAGAAGRAFGSFLTRHGHRALRELSLHQPGWADDPLPLVRALQVGTRTSVMSTATPRSAQRSAQDETARPVGLPLRLLLAWSRRTVRGREHSKSMLVDVVNRFKRAYRHLAHQLVQEGMLPDEDALFFLTHAELGQLWRSPDLADLALRRRRTLQRQQVLRFPTIFTGFPEPLDLDLLPGDQDELHGQPVSAGVVEGLARVVLSVEQADAIQPGEILIAPVTDIGWSPYFRIIAGLATDVGSAISHGAVVAREYRLPAVVNLGHASRLFRTGDHVRLDANRGVLQRLPKEQTP